MTDFDQLRDNIEDCAISLYFNLQEKSEPVYCVTYRDDTIIVHLDGKPVHKLPSEWRGWKVSIREVV